jgi:arylsulfatase A-like enzyme
VEHARGFALRQGDWKYIEPSNAGGQPQLYDLANDLAEQHNLAKQRPAKVDELAERLDKIRKSGRMP